jgi:ATP-binding cassette, subfamily C, bacterial CydC
MPDLKIRGLGFTYPGRGTPALQDLDLELPWKSRVAIMGPAGSGKSTLLHLLLRFWDYQRGQIVLNDRPLREYSGDQVRATMAVVSQHVFLFNASIAENLRLAAPGASDETLLAAARAAQLEDFIRALPQGLETPVGRFGARLSGGQARRLSVARALLKNAPILILDEPTEGLDPETEQAMWHTLAPLMQNRTVLLITHRPAGVEYMHRVHYLGKMEFAFHDPAGRLGTRLGGIIEIEIEIEIAIDIGTAIGITIEIGGWHWQLVASVAQQQEGLDIF